MRLIDIINENEDLEFRFFHRKDGLEVNIRQIKVLGLIKAVSYVFTQKNLHPNRGGFVDYTIRQMVDKLKD